MPKLYLHAGTYKTGTTALQRFAHANRKALLARGVFYADYGDDPLTLRFGHHDFAYSLADNNVDTFERLSKIVQYWHSVARAEGVPVLFSAETLFLRRLEGSASYWRAREDYMQRLAELLAPFDVEVILVYRRPDNFARSLYQERVASGINRLPEFPEWLAHGDPMLEYCKNACLIERPFSQSSHFIYEELTQGAGLYESFFNHLGASISGLDIPHIVRKSLTPAETVIKNYANDYISTVRQGRRFVAWMKEDGLGEELEGCHAFPLDLWESDRAREDFLADRQDDIEELRRRYFPDRQGPGLFPEFISSGVSEVPQISPTLRRKIQEYFTRG